MVWTNTGKKKMFEEFFATGAVDAQFRLVLCSGTYGDWNADTSSSTLVSAVSSAVEGTNGKGGLSGIVVLRDSAANQQNFDVSSSDQLNASAVRAVLQAGDNAYQYSGSFDDARYVVLVAAGAADSAFDFQTGTENIYAWWDIGSAQSISEGNTLTITSLSLQGQ